MSAMLATLARYALRTVFGVILSVAVLATLYLLFAYHFAYSQGESVGFVQKISHKGWVCKTWEGEQVRALFTVPAMPEKFDFTVRDAKVVDQINALIGQKVVLEYEQHKGLPSCFGDTEHFIIGVRPAPGEPTTQAAPAPAQ